MSTNEQGFEDFIVNRRGSAEREVLPSAYYDQDGDYLELLFSSDDHKSLRINSLMTVYVARDGSVVGLVLKDIVKQIKQHLPGLDLGEPVRVDRLFQAAAWLFPPGEENKQMVREIVSKAEASAVETLIEAR